jgi:predicted component of type VI protein secretion system
MVMTDDMKSELSLKFRALYELDEKVDGHKVEIKLLNASKKDTFKTLSDSMEVKQKALKKAYKDYVASIENPEETQEVDDIITTIKEYNLLKK